MTWKTSFLISLAASLYDLVDYRIVESVTLHTDPVFVVKNQAPGEVFPSTFIHSFFTDALPDNSGSFVGKWESLFTCPYTFKFRTRPLTGMASDSVRSRGSFIVQFRQQKRTCSVILPVHLVADNKINVYVTRVVISTWVFSFFRGDVLPPPVWVWIWILPFVFFELFRVVNFFYLFSMSLLEKSLFGSRLSLFTFSPPFNVEFTCSRARCSSVVRAFAHGAMGRRIDPSLGGPIELFLIPASAPRQV